MNTAPMFHRVSRNGGLRLAFAGALVALALLPPLSGNVYFQTLGVSACLFAAIAMAFNLVYGYTGLLCFAQVAFLGIGGYGAAILVTRAGWSFWAAAPAGAVMATLAGLLVAFSSLRLSRHSFGIATLTAALLCTILARDWVSLTRGSMGIPGLPAPVLRAGFVDVTFDNPARFFWLALAFAVIANLFLYVVIHSRMGRIFVSIRENEPLAISQGIDPLKYKLISVGISAFITGLCGSLMVFHLTIVDPSILDFYYTETMLIMVVIGGPGSFWSVLAASLVFSILPEILRFSTDLRLVLYGFLLILAMLMFPRGIAGVMEKRDAAFWQKRLLLSREQSR